MPDSQLHLSHPKYRPDIDGLRAVAVVAVVAFHAFPSWMKGGFIGVDVFFVISGYLISTILFENLERGTFSFAEFYSRRIRRIFPALILVLVACFAFGWFALLADEYKQLGKYIAAGAAFVSNLVLWTDAGYFDNSAETKPLLHLWSLGIEEQFYIAWPLLLWFAWKRKFNLLTITILVATISFVLNLKGVKIDAVATFYSPQTRFWELLAGSSLAWLTLYRRGAYQSIKLNIDGWGTDIYRETTENTGSKLANVLSMTGVVLLAYGFWRINKDSAFPGGWALIPVLGSLLIIAAGPKAWINRHILSNKIAVWFGLISFPLYLWHWPLLTFSRIIEGITPSREIRLAAVISSIVLAWVTYRFVEKPARHGGGIKVGILVVLMFIAGWIGYSTYDNDGWKLRSGINHFVKASEQLEGALWKYTKNDVCLNRYPYKEYKNLAYWFCVTNKDAGASIILMGNSFANQLYPGFIKNKLLSHHVVLSIGTCDFAGLVNNDDPNGPCFGDRPKKQIHFINELVAKEKTIRFAVIDGLSRAPDKYYIDSLKKRIDKIEAEGVRVIIFKPHVSPGFDPKYCIERPLKKSSNECEFPVDKILEIEESFKPVVDSLYKTNPRVLFFDQNKIYCRQSTCSYLLNGIPLFRDQGHISEYGSIEIQKYFNDWARREVPEIFLDNSVQVRIMGIDW